MKYDLVPVNGKILLKRATVETSPKEEKEITFLYAEPETIQGIEYFEVVELAKECGYTIHKSDIVTVGHSIPLGDFDGQEFFICDEREVLCRILPKNEIRDTK